MISRYTGFEKLGEGGMGVVYAATDTVLHRRVALKFLGGTMLAGDLARAQLLREARAAAALNHPAICTVYEVDEVREGEAGALGGGDLLVPGTPFIAMEHIEGRSLRDLLEAEGRLALRRILQIAIPIAEGLGAAHARGIVHRDLKPGNVMVGLDGRVKILDFGLAKALRPTGPTDPDATTQQTISATFLGEGRVVGTAAYMSPEQAAGRVVDHRTDVFAFGSLLYEMAAGRRAFVGDTGVTTLAKILESEPPPLLESRPDLPPEFSRIVRRCLKKTAEDRYNDTRDLVVELRDLRDDTSAQPAAPAENASRPRGAAKLRKRGVAIAGAVVILAAALGALHFGSRFRSAPAASGSGSPQHRQITFTGRARLAELSPDGSMVAWFEAGTTGPGHVRVRDASGGAPIDVLAADDASTLRWSPDGSQLLVMAKSGSELRGYVVPRLGGDPRRVRFTNSAAWSPDGKFIAGFQIYGKEISIVETASEKSTKVSVKGDYQWLHDLDWSSRGWFVVSQLDSANVASLWAVSKDGRIQERIYDSGGVIRSPRWSKDGTSVLFVETARGSTTMKRQDVDPASGRPSGPPRVLLSGLNLTAIAACGREGRYAYAAQAAARYTLRWQELGGPGAPARSREISTGTAYHGGAALSPDRTRIAFLRGAAESSLLSVGVDGGDERQLSLPGVSMSKPSWSGDGKRLVVAGQADGPPALFLVDAAGSSPPVKLPAPKLSETAQVTWCGTRILYQRNGNRNFVVLDPATGAEHPLIADDSVGWTFHPRCDASGGTAAVDWNRSDGSPGGVWLVSVADGSARLALPRRAYPLHWSEDGRFVFALVRASREVLRIPVSGGEAAVVATLAGDEVSDADVSSDGRQIVWTESNTPDQDVWIVDGL